MRISILFFNQRVGITRKTMLHINVYKSQVSNSTETSSYGSRTNYRKIYRSRKNFLIWTLSIITTVTQKLLFFLSPGNFWYFSFFSPNILFSFSSFFFFNFFFFYGCPSSRTFFMELEHRSRTRTIDSTRKFSRPRLKKFQMIAFFFFLFFFFTFRLFFFFFSL